MPASDAAGAGSAGGNATSPSGPFPPVLECRGVTAGYGDVQVLFGVDMHVERAEVVALLGANGAGKTTLLRAISGLERLWGGEVVFNSQPIDRVPAYRRVGDGLCQIVGGESVAEGLTVAEHLRLWSTTIDRRSPLAQQRLAEVFEVFPRLEERQSQVASTLSGGEKQMLALSKAIIVHPGKFCSAHLHWRKTEYYEVVLGEADVFYAPEIIDFPELDIAASEVIERTPMPKGDPRPADIRLPKGREQAWELLTSYQRVRVGDPKFVVPRKHLHGFGCPPDARTPLVIRENSTYNHEPTESSKGGPMPEWQHIHDNAFMHPGVAESRLGNNIREG